MWHSKNTLIHGIYLLPELLLSALCEAGIMHSGKRLWFLGILQKAFFGIDFYNGSQMTQDWGGGGKKEQKLSGKDLLTIFWFSGSLWILLLNLWFMQWLQQWIRESKVGGSIFWAGRMFCFVFF